MNNASTIIHLCKKLFFLLFLLPILLKANSNNYQENQPDFLECPTTNLVIASSQINEELINRWLNENSLAFESNIKNLGGIWASDDIIINHDYRGNLPSSVCNEEDGGLLVIFKATNSEKDVIRCGANLILLDDELIIPEETAITKFNSSNSLKSSIDSWLVTYPVSLRNLIADGPSKEFKENLIITHDYNGTLPNWTCQAENDNELIITFTIEDQCGNPIEVERRESFSPENIGSVVAVDECTPPADISLTYTDDISRINVDTILRKWMATDLCGNSDTILQIIKLVDRERFLDVPCAPDNVIISCRGNTANSAEISLWRTQIEENLKNTCFLNDATELSIHTSGASLFPSECGRRSGGTIFDYTISDSLGNFTIKRAKATIIDNVPPVLSTLNDGGVILRDSPFSLTVGLEMSNYHTRALQLGNSSFEAQCSNVQLRNDNTYPSNPNKDFPKRRYR